MRGSAALLAAATLTTCLAAAGVVHAEYLGPLAAQAKADGECVEVQKTVDATTGKTTSTGVPFETLCPQGVDPGSIVTVTYDLSPASQLAPDTAGSHPASTRTQTVEPQPPYANPYSSTVVKPKSKTTATTTPKH